MILEEILEIVSFVMFGITILFNVLSSFGIIGKSPGEISDSYKIKITPAGFTFSIWGIIYLWLLSIHVILSIPDLFKMNFQTSIFLIINYFLNSLWVILWGQEQIVACAFTIVGLLISLITTFFFSTRNIPYIQKDIYYYVINNGIAFYTAWVTIATIINILIPFYANKPDFSFVILWILIPIILAGWTLANYLNKSMLASIGYYPVFIWALIGIYLNGQIK